MKVFSKIFTSLFFLNRFVIHPSFFPVFPRFLLTSVRQCLHFITLFPSCQPLFGTFLPALHPFCTSSRAFLCGFRFRDTIYCDCSLFIAPYPICRQYKQTFLHKKMSLNLIISSKICYTKALRAERFLLRTPCPQYHTFKKAKLISTE